MSKIKLEDLSHPLAPRFDFYGFKVILFLETPSNAESIYCELLEGDSAKDGEVNTRLIMLRKILIRIMMSIMS